MSIQPGSSSITTNSPDHEGKTALCNWCLVVLNIPLITEVTRKFLVFSDMVFLAGDTLVLGTLFFLTKGMPRQLWSFRQNILVLSAILIWGAASLVEGHGNMFIATIGFRALSMPFVYAMISAYYFSFESSAVKKLFIVTSCWITVISLVALVQIMGGRDHTLNELPEEVETTGIGDYTVASEGLAIEGLFRPTSIFMHTGKFGQAIFTLVLFKWSLWMLARDIPRWMTVTVIIDLLGIVVSGQRAAGVFLTIAALTILALKRGTRTQERMRFRPTMMLIIVSGAICSAALSFVPDEIAELVIARFLSGYYEGWDRVIVAQLLNPAEYILREYWFMGEGIGFFTLGAAKYGGAILYEYLPSEGAAENSWLRIVSEIGIVGAALVLTAYVLIVRMAISRYRNSTDWNSKALAVFASLWVISMIVWGNTHDTLSNSLVMTLGMAFAGAVYSTQRIGSRAQGHFTATN